MGEERNTIAFKKWQIKKIKAKLEATDYQAIKYAERELSEEEYAPTKKLRKQWRNSINILEQEIKDML